METAVRLPSTIRIGGAVALAALLLAGCASPAPPLPFDTTGTTSLKQVSIADFTSADAALSCAEIASERADLGARVAKANANIKENRVRNQVASSVGLLVTSFAYIATEGNYADKDAIKNAYARQDVLEKLALLKGC
jgi:hypothetical protein